jgi:dihydrofolate reductase
VFYGPSQSIEDALNAALEDVKNTEKQALFIIGGGEIFKQTLSICNFNTVKLPVNVTGNYPVHTVW